MPYILKNNTLSLTVSLPGELYKGCRFDHNGAVIQINYKGINLLSKETVDNFDEAQNGQGLYEEFGIKNPVGYDEVQEGDFFPKIGTGWLTKDSEAYFFAKSYKMKKLEHSVNYSDDTITLICTSGLVNGYSYIYTKSIALRDNGFVIDYNFRNTGTRQINTTHYVHNFICPEQKELGENITLDFSWSFDPERLVENVRTNGLLSMEGGTIKMLKTPETDFFMGGIAQSCNEGCIKSGRWTLMDSYHKIKLTEEDSFIPVNADLWGYKYNISPEMFYGLSAAPGETCQWKRHYIITDL